MTTTAPLLEVKNLSKYFGSVIALEDISMFVRADEVTCLLGDNGAGKSTLIKALAGVHKPTKGEYLFDGKSQLFDSPREALELGIATVFQDLAMIPLMSIWRNFFLGSEPKKGVWPFRTFDVEKAKQITREEISRSARCPAVSVSRSRSPGPSTSAQKSSSSMSPRRHSA